jgi:hypothetical protein
MAAGDDGNSGSRAGHRQVVTGPAHRVAHPGHGRGRPAGHSGDRERAGPTAAGPQPRDEPPHANRPVCRRPHDLRLERPTGRPPGAPARDPAEPGCLGLVPRGAPTAGPGVRRLLTRSLADGPGRRAGRPAHPVRHAGFGAGLHAHHGRSRSVAPAARLSGGGDASGTCGPDDGTIPALPRTSPVTAMWSWVSTHPIAVSWSCSPTGG